MDFIKTVLLPTVKDYFRSVLSVQPVLGNLIIPGVHCGPSRTTPNPKNASWACCKGTVPSYLGTVGIPKTDFLVHISARPTNANVIAWAIPCNIDQYGRPISAQANFGPHRYRS